jgi:8-oxo-dGTP diphosphatase
LKSGASAVVILNNDQKILLLKRHPGCYWMADKWGLPGGFTENSETTKETATREIFEETGLTLESNSLKLLSLNKKVAIYTANVYNDAIQIDHEHVDWAWVKRQNLTTYEVVPRIGELFDMALNYDKK